MNSGPTPGREPGDPFVVIDADLNEINTLPAAEQVPVFSRIHGALTAALATTAAANDGGPAAGGWR